MMMTMMTLKKKERVEAFVDGKMEDGGDADLDDHDDHDDHDDDHDDLEKERMG